MPPYTAPAAAPTTKSTTRPSLQTPLAKTVQQFHDALRAIDERAAMNLLATSPEPVRDADRRIHRLAQNLAGGTWDFAILDAKESGDLGVVLINDYLKDTRKTTDIKPWYLIRQQGAWKLLGKFTDFELKEYCFDEKTLDEYRKLEDWSERRTPELKRELPDCGC
jgi:hypothetical protein